MLNGILFKLCSFAQQRPVRVQPVRGAADDAGDEVATSGEHGPGPAAPRQEAWHIRG